MKYSEYVRVINDGQQTPEKIFERLGLPIVYIDDVMCSGKGRMRKFLYNEKEYFCPEVVAKAYYESQGHQCYWTEGLAIELVHDALFKACTFQLRECFELQDVDGGLLLQAITLDKESLEKQIERELKENKSHAGNRESAYESIFKKRDGEINNHEKGLNSKIAREARILSDSRFFPFSLSCMLEGNLDRINETIKGFVSIKSKCTASEFIHKFKEGVDAIKSNKEKFLSHIEIPQKGEKKDYSSDFFRNEWTYKAAVSIAMECDFDYLIGEVASYGSINPRWDLTLIDNNTKRLRYIEVKYQDGFTDYQLRRLPYDLDNGVVVELCVVKAKQ